MKKYFFLKFIIVVFILNGCSTVYNSSTGKKHISFISTSKEIKIGKSLSENIEKHFGVIDDIKKQSRIEIIGQKLAKVSYREEIAYHFDILEEDDSPNALALPGGYVYITSALFDELETDSQLASVLAHEMAHIEARHSIYRLQKALGYKALGIIISQNASKTATYKSSQAIGELFLTYSRKDEFEADSLSIEYLKKTGYDPNAIIEVLQKLKKINKEKPIEKLKIRTHPYVNDRIRETKIILKGKIDFTDYMNKTFETKK